MKKLLVVGLMMSNLVFAQNKKSDTVNYNRSVEEDLSYLVSEKEQIKAEKKEKPLPLSKKGQVFVFYGWNRAAYSNSYINFNGNG